MPDALYEAEMEHMIKRKDLWLAKRAELAKRLASEEICLSDAQEQLEAYQREIGEGGKVRFHTHKSLVPAIVGAVPWCGLAQTTRLEDGRPFSAGDTIEPGTGGIEDWPI